MGLLNSLKKWKDVKTTGKSVTHETVVQHKGNKVRVIIRTIHTGKEEVIVPAKNR